MLNILNMWDNQSIRRINSNTNIMRAVDRILKLRLFRSIGWVHNRILPERKRKCFDHDTHQSNLSFILFEYLSHFFGLCDIELLMEIQVRNLVAFGHRFLHTFFEVSHLLCWVTLRCLTFGCWWTGGLRFFCDRTWEISSYIWLEYSSVSSTAFYFIYIQIFLFY